MKQNFRVTILAAIGILAGCLLVLLPLIRPGFFISDDGEWMVIRLSAFYQALRDGQIPVRFLGRLNFGWGYPVANFLYPGFLYVGVALHVLGFSFVDAVKLILGGSVVGSALFLFLWLRSKWSALASFIGTLAFIFSPYLIFDLYNRGSVGEVFAFLPATLSGYAISRGKRRMLPFAVSLLILSHNSLAVLFLGFLFTYIVYKRQWQDFLFVAVGIGMATFYWLPAWAERRYVRFDSIVISHPEEYFAWGIRFFLLNIVALLAAVFFLWPSRIRIRKDIPLFLTTFFLAVFFSLPVSFLFWKDTIIQKFFQFPFRFLALAAVTGAWLVAGIIEGIRKRFRFTFFAVITLIWAGGMVPIISDIAFVNRPETYYTTNEATTTVGDEYMPRWVRDLPREHIYGKLEFAKGNGHISIQTQSTRKIVATITPEGASVIQVNTVYYPGWGVLVDDHPVVINYDNANGAIQFDVDPGTHKVLIEFRETVLRFFADAVSLFFSVVAVIFLVMQVVVVKKTVKAKHT